MRIVEYITKMEILTLVKTLLGAVTVVVGLVSGVIQIRKNPNYWLNRFFAGFFACASIGFFGYVLYHIILTNIDLVLPINIITNIILNLSMACLLMTEFILEHSERRAMSSKYLLITLGLFLSSVVGYAIWPPSIDADSYALGEVNTHQNMFLLVYISLYRVGIAFFVLIKFFLLVKITKHKPTLLK